MPTHVFVDETKSRGLLLAAARCDANDVAVQRKALRGLLLAGQERLHFNHERPARRRQLLELIKTFGISVALYQADRDDARSRAQCLTAVVRDHALGAERLVVEEDESTRERDRQTLHAATIRYSCVDTMRWGTLPAKADPLLWIPDAVAWSWRRGGDWRRAVAAYCEAREV